MYPAFSVWLFVSSSQKPDRSNTSERVCTAIAFNPGDVAARTAIAAADFRLNGTQGNRNYVYR